MCPKRSKTEPTAVVSVRWVPKAPPALRDKLSKKGMFCVQGMRGPPRVGSVAEVITLAPPRKGCVLDVRQSRLPPALQLMISQVVSSGAGQAPSEAGQVLLTSSAPQSRDTFSSSPVILRSRMTSSPEGEQNWRLCRIFRRRKDVLRRSSPGGRRATGLIDGTF
jgi:hypothetical protein